MPHSITLKITISLLLVVSLAGCGAYKTINPQHPGVTDPVLNSSYNIVVGAKAFLDSVKLAHPECVTTANTSICQKLNQATKAKDLLIDAGEVYCGGAGFETGKTPCNPPAKGTAALQTATDKLSAAMTAYKQIEADLKGAIK